MNRISVLVGVILLISVGSSIAQETVEVSDEELTKYATVALFGDTEKAKMKTKLNGWIQAEELMKGGRKFKAIKDTGMDEAKLKEAEVTEEELTVYKAIQEKNDSMISEFKAAYTAKIKDKEVLGASIYNKVKKALRTDEELKGRYKKIYEELESKMTEDAGGEESDSAGGH